MNVYLHREVAGVTYGEKVKVDHKNGDKLDNRDENLRRATQRANIHYALGMSPEETAERDAEIRRLHAEGHNYNQIARLLGISYGTARHIVEPSYRLLQNARVAARKAESSLAKREAQAARNETIIRLYGEGLTQAVVAKQVGTTQAWVSEILRERGVETRRPGRPKVPS